ncbi:unnamed protein product [Lactuca virosa]|uniref:Uncharacterized protein n=1 Tax=Lactuca virosa TaxID=75947 RepID=A0AAU9NU18_9ASTR|nr:unnamed protein product [Lactuca virosa]
MYKPMFHWIKMEEPEVEDDTNSNEDQDDDSLLVDKEGWDHEVDDENVFMKRERASIQHKDRFLNKLCPDVEEEEVLNVEQLPPIYHVHNFEQRWDQMAPVLGDPILGSLTPVPIPTPRSTSATPAPIPTPRSTSLIPTPIPTPRSTSSTPAPILTPRSTSATPISTSTTPRSTYAGLVRSEVQVRKRRASERIIKQCLRKRVMYVDGSGCSSGNM